jgi:hypothetical protein
MTMAVSEPGKGRIMGKRRFDGGCCS